MEVESEDEEDEREGRDEGQPSQPDQDTQVQDMDEVGNEEVICHCAVSLLHQLVVAILIYFYSSGYY